MSPPNSARRIAEAAISLLASAATAVTVLWFYDWVSRWYVVVGVLLAVASAAVVVERLARPAPSVVVEPED